MTKLNIEQDIIHKQMIEIQIINTADTVNNLIEDTVADGIEHRLEDIISNLAQCRKHIAWLAEQALLDK